MSTKRSELQVCVMTSGGDSQGMNAAIRAIVRRGLLLGAHLFGIHNGYQGLVDGGENIKPLVWDDVSGFLQVGGTVLGSSRCLPFKDQFPVRTLAVFNLLVHGIDRLIVIGGDGSLSGASKLADEWSDHLQFLRENDKISQETFDKHPRLYVVGVPGSIDNDMWGTDLTIGCDTALHRIAESLNSIMTTASSHQRVFVVEIMGRNCGYLALMSALSTGADYVFIPEHPAKSNWQQELIETIKIRRRNGSKHNVIIVAEGAIDENGTSIKCYDVKKIIEAATGADTRETILGHVQRGGAPSALDRYISTILGVRAVEVALEAKEGFIPVMIGTVGGKTIETNLSECVRNTRRVAKEMENKNYEAAFALRDYCFKESFKLVQVLSSTAEAYPPPSKCKTIAILHVGSPCPGMNAAVRAAARMAISKGYIPFLFYNGFTGVANSDGFICTWRGVANWAHQGGAHLGSNREIPSKVGYKQIADTLAKYHINGLVIIGGWTAYLSAKELYENSNTYPQFKIPIVCVPASIGNNCPGTNMSIGSDTALNVIVNTSDAIKCSGLSSRRRIFIVEVMGSYSGYLALAGGISAGAHLCYTPEKGIALDQVLDDIKKMKTRFSTCLSTSLILNSENASHVYTTQMLKELFQEESEEMYDVRMLILGHVQQGNLPSPQDRIFASLLGSHAVSILEDKIENLKDTWYGSIGIDEFGLKESQFSEIEPNMDFSRKVARDSWWKEYFPVIIRSLQQSSETQKFRPLHEATTSHLFQEPPAELIRSYSLKRDHVVEIFSGEHTHLSDLNDIPLNVEVKEENPQAKNKPRRPWAAMTLSGPRAEQQQRYKYSSSSANIKMINIKDLQDGKKKEDGHKESENGHSQSHTHTNETHDKKSTTPLNEGPTKKPSENLRISKKEERKKKESKKIDAKKKDLLATGDATGQQKNTPNTSYGASNTSVSPHQTFISSSSSGGYHHHSHHANVTSNTNTNPNPIIDSRLSQEAQKSFWGEININNLVVGTSLVALGCSLGYLYQKASQ